MSVVCGIDLGSLKTPSYVAWLKGGTFHLDAYLASVERPLPEPPAILDVGDHRQVAAYAIDAPQGLPAEGRPRREADEAAGTPTRKLPKSRTELEESRLYRELIRAGLEVFWSVHANNIGGILGLDPRRIGPLVMETYPRASILGLLGGPIPSKRKETLAYVDLLWDFLRNEGYRCPSVTRPSVDQIDAMFCALAAETAMGYNDLRERTLGRAPAIDRKARVIREGYIVVCERASA